MAVPFIRRSFHPSFRTAAGLAALAAGVWGFSHATLPAQAAPGDWASPPSGSGFVRYPFREAGKVGGLLIVDFVTPPAKVTDPFALALATGDAAKAKADLVRQIQAALGAGGAETLKQAARDDKTRLALMRHEVLRLVGLKTIQEIRARPQGADFLARFMASPQWLEDFLVAGPFGDRFRNASALHFLCTLYRYDKRCTQPLYRKLACAWSRNQKGDWTNGAVQCSLLDTWQTQVRLHGEGRMHASFDRLESWEMMSMTSCDDAEQRSGDGRSLAAMAYDRHCPQRAYDGACWEIPWVDTNQFGDSCQADPYYAMWRNDYVRGCPSTKKVWGVCGTLSTFGAFNARAHGIPSFPVGQPGHCAYMLRADDTRWETPYTVGWPTSTGSSFFGRGDESIVRLMQAAYANGSRPALLRAHQHLWQRNFLLAAGEVELESGTLRTYGGGRGASVGALAKLQPVGETTADAAELFGAVTKLSGWRGATWEGGFTLAAETQLLCATTSDDGSRMHIDGQQVVDNDGSHGAITREGRVTLPAGRHTLRLEYYDGGGGAEFSFKLGGAASTPPAARKALELALAECPLDLNAWRLVIADLRADPATDPAAWKQFGAKFATAMKDYPHPAWDVLEAEVYPALKDKWTPAEKSAWIASLHAVMRRGDGGNPLVGFFTEHLDAQANFIGKADGGISLFTAALATYADAKGDLPHVLKWANGRFTGDKTAGPAYIAELGRFFASPRGGGGNALNTFSDLMVAAETKGDVATGKAVAGILPPLLAGQDAYAMRHFDRGAADKFPKTRTFSGKLLSADGILMPSSHYDAKLALTHPDVLAAGGIGGLLHTKNEVKPQVTLKLPGKATLSGLVIVNRYERMGDRNLPLKVSVSENGKDFAEVFATRENKPAWEVDLAKTAPKAQFVRIERTDDRKEAMNLRAIRVYGTPLY